MHRLLRALRRLGLLALAIFVLWFGGLAYFVASSLSIRGDPSTPTDAIVVLTGGRLRLETGLPLLAAGRAKKLFVSGVNQRVGRAGLLRPLRPGGPRPTGWHLTRHEAGHT